MASASYHGSCQNTLTENLQYYAHGGTEVVLLKREYFANIFKARQAHYMDVSTFLQARVSFQTSLCLPTQKSSCRAAGAPFQIHPSPQDRAVINSQRGCSNEAFVCTVTVPPQKGEGENTAGMCLVFPSHLIMLIIRHKRTGVFSRQNLTNWIAPLCWAGGEFATPGLLQCS